MTLTVVKNLFEQGRMQDLLSHLAQWKKQEEWGDLSSEEQLECVFFQSRAYRFLRKWKEAFEVAAVARDNVPPLDNPSILLGLVATQMDNKKIPVDKILEISKEGDALFEKLKTTERETGAYWIAMFELAKGIYHIRIGEYDSVFPLLQRSLEVFERMNNSSGICVSLIQIGRYYQVKNEGIKALEYLKNALNLVKAHGYAFWNNFSLYWIGEYYTDHGDYNRAIKYFSQSLTGFKVLENTLWICELLGCLGVVHYYKGELGKALDYNKRNLAICETVGDPFSITSALEQIGTMYSLEKDFDTALSYLQRSLAIKEKIGYTMEIAYTLMVIGLFYWSKGEIDNAELFLQRSVTKYAKTEEKHPALAMALFYLVLITLERQDQPTTQMYLTQLQDIGTYFPNIKNTQTRCQLAEALVLKQNPRLKDKFQAQSLLEHIVNGEESTFFMTTLAIIHLCELLVLELKATSNPDIVTEATTLIQRLQNLAQDKHFFGIILDSLLLQAKFSSIQGDLHQAQGYLDQARNLVEEHNLTSLISRVTNEQKRFETEFETMQKLIQSNKPLQKRVQYIKIEAYIQRATKMIAKLPDDGSRF